jgi:abortive infection bacteriophage resistance protein
MRPFQIKDDPNHNFEYGIGFRELFELYEFEGRLRLVVMDEIERVEVAGRALTSNHMSPTYGAQHSLSGSTRKWRGFKASRQNGVAKWIACQTE